MTRDHLISYLTFIALATATLLLPACSSLTSVDDAEMFADAEASSELIISLTPHLVYVDYDQYLEDTLTAGEYDWIDNDITSRYFPMKGEGASNVALTLVRLSRFATTLEIVEELAEHDLQPAEMEHLLAYGAASLNDTQLVIVVALGSGWSEPDSGREVPFISQLTRRDLGLRWAGPDYHWGPGSRILALNK